jgi:hypothetical protein
MKAQQLMRSPRKGRAHHCERKITRETVSNTAVLHFKDMCAHGTWAPFTICLHAGRCLADRSCAAKHRACICKQVTFRLFDRLSNYLGPAFMTSSLPAVKHMTRPCLDLRVDAILVEVAAARAGVWHLPPDMNQQLSMSGALIEH